MKYFLLMFLLGCSFQDDSLEECGILHQNVCTMDTITSGVYFMWKDGRGPMAEMNSKGACMDFLVRELTGDANCIKLTTIDSCGINIFDTVNLKRN